MIPPRIVDSTGKSFPGSYLLFLYNRLYQRIEIGRLGRVVFSSGRHVYCGSAHGGLLPRVLRHLRGDGKVHWHIDRLTERWEREGAMLFPLPGPGECQLAAMLASMPGVRPGPVGFGASDCHCETHLFRLPRFFPCQDLINFTAPGRLFWCPASNAGQGINNASALQDATGVIL